MSISSPESEMAKFTNFRVKNQTFVWQLNNVLNNVNYIAAHKLNFAKLQKVTNSSLRLNSFILIFKAGIKV